MTHVVRRKGTSCLCLALTSVWTVTIVPGCGAGGGGGGGGALPPAAVRATPGQFITLQHPSIVAGSTVEARFEGPNGYVVELESFLTQNGSAKVVVPPFVDPGTGEFRAAEVMVSVSGFTSDQPLMIEELPQVDDAEPGFALKLLLQSAVEQYQAALNNLDAVQAAHPDVDVSAASADVAEEIARLEALLAELDSTAGLSVVLPDGTSTVLGAAELSLADRWVVAVLRGAEEELGISGKSALRMQTIPGFGDVQASINRVLDGLKSGLNGDSVLLGIVSLGLTAVGVFGGVPIATVAGAFGLAVTIGSSVFSWGVGVFTDSNSDSFLGLDRTGFDAAQEFLSQGVRIATQAASGLGESAINLANAISTSLTVKDTMVSAEGTTCQAPEEQKDVRRFQTIGEFCAITPPNGGGTEGPGCENTCTSARDGFCDDGGMGSFLDTCFLGTDCADCGPRDVSVCSDTCRDAGDNICDDGGPGSVFAICDLGTDCTDCGPRSGTDTPPPPPVDCSDLTPGGGTVCADTCDGANNGVCEEPETAHAQFAFCLYGTDCTDCGPRPEITGACCRSDGCCAITTTEACQAVAGATYFGDLTDCEFCVGQ